MPYFGLRSYTDGGEHYAGQIGSEETPREYVANLLDCTREWMRVLKPGGSIFVNLGDKYSGDPTPGGVGSSGLAKQRGGSNPQVTAQRQPRRRPIGRPKCLLGLPWRYALGCIDDLGLILRAEIVWNKPNGLPESVSDRVRRSHEQVFHFTRQPRYFAAVDEIREAHTMKPQRRPNGRPEDRTPRLGQPKQTWPTAQRDEVGVDGHPLGKLPGSVWDIPSAPLAVPAHLGVDHFAAYPPELVRRIVLGWSPPGICTECGEGRRPVTQVERIPLRPGDRAGVAGLNGDRAHGFDRRAGTHVSNLSTITGYSCACTPYTDHPGSGEATRRRDYSPGPESYHAQGTYGRKQAGEYERVGPWREYHLKDWRPPPARAALVVDPFGGTGTTALVADMLGRNGISFDRSADYCRLARWRTTDPGERAKAMQVPKPPPVPDGQDSLFGREEAS